MKKKLFIVLLLQSILYSEVNTCDTLAGNPFDKQLKTQGISFKNIIAVKAISVCLKELKEKPNDTQIMYQLGRAFDSNKNYTKTIFYYKKACDKGYASACNSLGIKHYYGEGVNESDETALKFYKKACNIKKNSSGCTNVAGMYQYGKGVKQSIDKAKEYYAIACKRGDKSSCKLLIELNTKP